MELQPDPDSPSHRTIVTYETPEEYWLVHPNRLRMVGRCLLQGLTFLEPLQFPSQWSVSNKALERRENELLLEGYYMQGAFRPGGRGQQQEILELRRQVVTHLENVG
jgi:hypothetical protein